MRNPGEREENQTENHGNQEITEITEIIGITQPSPPGQGARGVASSSREYQKKKKSNPEETEIRQRRSAEFSGTKNEVSRRGRVGLLEKRRKRV